MKAMVLAAGLGIRLRPLTESVPKPLLPLGPHPLLVWNLLLLRRHGVENVVINLHYLGKQIREALGDGAQWRMHLSYSEEPVLLGTGGGIKQVEAFFEDEPFLVLNGDTIADLDLSELVTCHQKKKALATMALRDDPDVDRWGVIETDEDDRVLRIQGKGDAAQREGVTPRRRMFAGIHVIDPFMLRHVPQGSVSSIIDAYVWWLQRGATVSGYVFSGYWSDVGTPERYAQAQRDVKAGIINVPE